MELISYGFLGVLLVCFIYRGNVHIREIRDKKKKLQENRKKLEQNVRAEQKELKNCSKPDFDFPNRTLELEAKIGNTGTDVSNMSDKMKIKHYCEY